ncbi:DinB family protein [Litoribacillus peritrichatus]|uniref:DinB family protein n=1 Tax=Litoribacillus peritrichatus TaxID=718191 RepID=A0ABP7MB41_9GAMM
MQKVINASIEILDQISNFIMELDDASYTKVSKPLFDSSIGQHLRHILDIFQALMTSENGDLIDYDLRRRGIPLETDRMAGLQEIDQVREWLLSLEPEQLDNDVVISTEVALVTQQTAEFRTTFGRELCFASSHLTHHLALMVVHAKLLGLEVDSQLGVAPATATYIREQEETSCAH